MVVFDVRTVRHLQALARIKLVPEEEPRLVEQLREIVGFVDRVRGASGEGLKDPGDGTEGGRPPGPLREDVVRSGLEHDDVIAMAPESENGCFRVPPVLDDAGDADR